MPTHTSFISGYDWNARPTCKCYRWEHWGLIRSIWEKIVERRQTGCCRFLLEDELCNALNESAPQESYTGPLLARCQVFRSEKSEMFVSQRRITGPCFLQFSLRDFRWRKTRSLGNTSLGQQILAWKLAAFLHLWQVKDHHDRMTWYSACSAQKLASILKGGVYLSHCQSPVRMKGYSEERERRSAGVSLCSNWNWNSFYFTPTEKETVDVPETSTRTGLNDKTKYEPKPTGADATLDVAYVIGCAH